MTHDVSNQWTEWTWNMEIMGLTLSETHMAAMDLHGISFMGVPNGDYLQIVGFRDLGDFAGG